MESSSKTTNEWPGGFGIYNQSKEIVMKNLATFALLVFGSSAAAFFLGFFPFIGDLISLVIQMVAMVAIILVSFAGIKGEKLSFEDSIKASFSMTAVKVLLLTLLMGLILVGSFLALIVPFFIVLPRIALAPYLLVAQNLGIRESLRKSWDITKDHSGKVWGVIGVSLLFGILCIVLIGIYFSFMYTVAFAILTTYLLKQPATQTTPAKPSGLPLA